MFLMDLQLFADPDPKKDIELEDEELELYEEEEAEVAEEEELDEEIEVEVEAPKAKDKKTAAIIREKAENKRLKEENAALKREKAEAERQRQLEAADKEYRKKLADKGYTEDEIEDKATLKREQEELKRDVRQQKYERQAEKLSSKYPEITSRLDEFIRLVEKSNGDLTLEEVCRAKLGESSAYEIRTKAEQEVLINKSKAASKKTVVGESKPTDSVKFSKEDEEGFQFFSNKNPGITRAEYKKILDARRW